MKEKKQINKKTILGLGAFVCLIGIVALCSFFPFAIDPTRWQTTEFLSDELIIVAIIVFAMICWMFIAQSSNAKNPKSQIAQAKVKFLGGVIDGRKVEGSVEQIYKGQISQFKQWVKQVLQPRDMQTARERIVLHAGVEDVKVLELTDNEIAGLVGTPQKYGDRFYKSITKKQCKEIIRAKRMRFKLVDPSYYLSCSKLASEKTATEQSSEELKKKTVLLTWTVASRIVFTVLVGMIFMSLVYDSASGVGPAKAWMKFLSRMFSLLTSSFMGYLVGCQMNDIDAYYIELKCSIHDEFKQDKSFKPKGQQELAKEEFIDRVKKENVLMLEG